MKHPHVRRTMVTLTCTSALIASLTACGSGDNKAVLPLPAKSANASTTAITPPATTPPTPVPTATATGPAALAANSTYTYGGLKVVVNLPADIPEASLPSLRLFSEFLQAVGRTKAQNKLDPSLPALASASVVKYVQSSTVQASVQGIGSVIYRVNRAQSGASGFAVITGCLDQSKLVQVRKDGSRFIAQAKRYPTLKMTANISPGSTGPKVTAYTFALGSC